MKHYMVSLLCLLLCVSVGFSVRVNATSYDPGYNFSYDILSLSTADGDNHVAIGEYGSVTFDLPLVLNGNYVDIVISTSSGAITAAQCGNASAQQDLNVLAVSNRVFRVYGTINNRSFTELQLNLTSNNASTSIDFLSFRLFKPAVNIHQTVGRLSCMVLSMDEQHYGQTYYGEVLTAALPWATGQSEIDTASILLTVPTWQKYDHVEFMVYGKFSSVDAIVARVDDVSLPFTVTPLDGSADVYASHSDNVWRNMVISVDLRDVVRSNTPAEDLRFRVDMNISYYNGAQAMFYLNTVNGIIDSSVTVTEDRWWVALGGWLDDIGSKITVLNNSFTNWINDHWMSFSTNWNNAIDGFKENVLMAFDNLYNKISTRWTQYTSWLYDVLDGFKENVLNAFDTFYDKINIRWTQFSSWLYDVINPDSSAVDDFVNDAQNTATEIGGLVDGLNDVNKPDVNDINTSVEIYVNDTGMNVLAGTISNVLNFSHFTNMIMIVIVLMLGGFVLFGKR